MDPDAEHVLGVVEIDSSVWRPRCGPGAVTDLHHDGAKEDDRVELFGEPDP